MSVSSMVKQLYKSQVASDTVRQVVYPAGLVGVQCVSAGAVGAWAWAAYVQIVAAAVVANPCWLIGIYFQTNVVETFYGDIAIAIGAGGLEVDLAIIPVKSIIVGATAQTVGTNMYLPIMLAKPIRINGTPRLACRLRKSTGASVAGGTLKAICVTGLV